MQRAFREALARFGDPLSGMRLVHVAGTNGKGSTGAMLAQALRLSGQAPVGHFCSPHVLRYEERIQIDARPISEAELAEIDGRIDRADIDPLIKRHYFARSFLQACLAFRERNAKACVIETGIGGLEDVTSVISPVLSLITTIDFDHRHILGNTLSEIAAQKAGIIKPRTPAVSANQRPEAEDILRRAAEGCGAPIRFFDPASIHSHSYNLTTDPPTMRFSIGSVSGEATLLGSHQLQNIGTAILACEALGIPRETTVEAIRRTRWTGRMQRLSTDPPVWVDGAHNDQAISVLLKNLEELGIDKPLLIFGMHAGKISDLWRERLFSACFRLFPVEIEKKSDEEVDRAVDAALSEALRESGGRAILVCGSLYLFRAVYRRFSDFA